MEITPHWLPEKHDPVFRENKDFVMSIRRLPAHAVSKYFAERQANNTRGTSFDAPETLDGRDLGEWLIENRSSAIMRLYTKYGTVLPKYFIRSESLRDDLRVLLQRYYKLGPGRLRIIQNGTTKNSNVYDHDISRYFSEEQIKRLYDKDPTWAQMESKAYSSMPFQ